MLYAKYGRTGVYMLQDLFRFTIGVEQTPGGRGGRPRNAGESAVRSSGSDLHAPRDGSEQRCRPGRYVSASPRQVLFGGGMCIAGERRRIDLPGDGTKTFSTIRKASSSARRRCNIASRNCPMKRSGRRWTSPSARKGFITSTSAAASGIRVRIAFRGIRRALARLHSDSPRAAWTGAQSVRAVELGAGSAESAASSDRRSMRGDFLAFRRTAGRCVNARWPPGIREQGDASVGFVDRFFKLVWRCGFGTVQLPRIAP